MFIATIVSMAKRWAQSKCSTTDEQIQKMWYAYTMKYYLAIKKGWMGWGLIAATWMNLEDMPSEKTA